MVPREQQCLGSEESGARQVDEGGDRACGGNLEQVADSVFFR